MASENNICWHDEQPSSGRQPHDQPPCQVSRDRRAFAPCTHAPRRQSPAWHAEALIARVDRRPEWCAILTSGLRMISEWICPRRFLLNKLNLRGPACLGLGSQILVHLTTQCTSSVRSVAHSQTMQTCLQPRKQNRTCTNLRRRKELVAAHRRDAVLRGEPRARVVTKSTQLAKQC